MKILQINCVYKTGSTGKIVYDIHSELLKKKYLSIVCYGRGRNRYEEDVYQTSNDILGKINNVTSRLTGILYGGSKFETLRLFHIIRKENPDIVHLHCLNGFFVNIYQLFKWLGKHDFSVVLTLHAEFMYTGSCGYALDCNAWKETGCRKCPCWKEETKSLIGDRTSEAWKRMKDAINRVNTNKMVIVTVSPWLEKRSKQSVILRRFKHYTVLNGINTDVFKLRDELKEALYPTADCKYVIFHATAMFHSNKEHIKGGYYLLELAKRLKDFPVEFYIAGVYESGIQVPDNVTLLGKIENQKKLAAYYSAADLTLLTSKRETFSMICAESLCCGTPIVGFYAGAPETIAIPEYSSFVEFGNIDALERAVEKTLKKKFEKKEIAQKAADLYGKQKMVEKYCEIYKELYLNGRV